MVAEPTASPDGPRALRGDEWPLLDHLVSTVFRPEMFHDYPQLFNAANRANLRVIREGDQVVTHVGFTVRPAVLLGSVINVACIGAVATAPEARGRGLGSMCVQDAFDHASAAGVDLMLISGGRGLYTRVGCREVGVDHRFILESGDTAGRAGVARPGLALVPVTAADIRALGAIHEREAVRFVRPRDDWERAFDCGIVMNTPSDFWGVADGSGVIAYVVVHRPDRVRYRKAEDALFVRVVEHAGPRDAVAHALPALIDRYGAARAEVHVGGHDMDLVRALRHAGLHGVPEASSGTIRVVDFPRLMGKVRPLIAGRTGHDLASRLVFEADERAGSARGGFSIGDGTRTIRVADHASLGPWLFGTPEGTHSVPQGDPSLAADLASALPLPALWYGVNYV
ncbi:MAG: GNAT family N-acetyltransferase [Chloroflexi bacterium]|nr:GNAT family N-acetyltransferase [Chloroflexota bacterium]